MFTEKDEYLRGNLDNGCLIHKIRTDISQADNTLVASLSTPEGLTTGAYPEYRDCDTIQINLDSYIANGLKDLLMTINRNKWQETVKDEWSHVSYFRYRRPGHHMQMHLDSCPNPDMPQYNGIKLTVVLCLSRPEEYEGCEFTARLDSGEEETFKLGYGDFIAFRSMKMVHKVAPLISGDRSVIVGFYK